MVLRRNQGPIFGIFTIEGYNQLKLAAFQDFKVPVDLRLGLLNVKYRSVIRPMRGEVALVANPGYLPRAFVVPHAQRVSDGEEALAVLNDPAFDPRREVVIQPAPGHARRDTEEVPGEGTPEGNASVAFRRYGPNEIDLEVDSPLAGTLVLSEIYYPAWKVTVNGESRSLLRADYCLRGVEIPAGKSEVVFRMSDAPLRHGLLVTVAALVGAGIIGVWERR
jgi:hypothetical protein